MLILLKESITPVIMYLFVYNVSLLALSSLILSLNPSSLKSLSSLTFLSKSVKKYLIVLYLFSIAGLPPFIGFITKINLILVGINSSFFFFILFFSFFFAVMYFYIQNIRFLLQPSISENTNFFFFYSNNSSFFVTTQSLFLVITINGIFFLDDFLILSSWLFIF